MIKVKIAIDMQNCLKKDAKNGFDFIIVSAILYHGDQHYRARQMLIRDKKSPFPFLCIIASTLESSIVLRSCFTKLYRLLITNRARYFTKDEH